jgi:MFS family permease
MVRRLLAQLKGYPRALWYLFIGQLINVVGFSIVLPFLGLYLNTKLGVPMTIVGTVFLVASLTRSGALVLGGELSDLFGRRRVMLVALGSRIGTFALLGYLVAVRADVLYVGAAVVLSYALGAIYQPAASAFVSDVMPSDKRIEGFSLLRIGANAGWAIGPAIGGLLAAYVSYSSLFYATTLCFGITFVFMLFVVPETHTRQKGQRFSVRDIASTARDRRFMAFCAMCMLMFIVMAQLVTTLAVFSKTYVGLSEKDVGRLYTFNGILVVLLQLPLAAAIRRWNHSLAMAAATMFFVTGYFLVGFAMNMYFLMLCVVFITTGEMLMSPTSQTLVAGLAPKANVGRYMGVFGLTRSTGWALGPFIGGMAMDTAVFAADPRLLWGFIVSVGVVGALGFVLLRNELAKGLSERGRVASVPCIEKPCACAQAAD